MPPSLRKPHGAAWPSPQVASNPSHGSALQGKATLLASKLAPTRKQAVPTIRDGDQPAYHRVFH